MSEEPGCLTEQMDSMIADSSNGAAHTVGHSSENNVGMPTEPRYLNQEDTPTDPSNGSFDPATDVQRKLQTIGTGSCGGFNSCNGVTASSIIGDNSCTYYSSCYEL